MAWTNGIVRIYQESYAIFCAVVIGATMKMYVFDYHVEKWPLRASTNATEGSRLSWVVFVVVALGTFFLMSSWGTSRVRHQIGLSTLTCYFMRQCTEMRVVYLAIMMHCLYSFFDFYYGVHEDSEARKIKKQ